jgi:hypothetical protein
MRAIVLSCDRYHLFARHMVACYEALWSDHPFIFRVPWQATRPTFHAQRLEAIQTRPSIRETVLQLLEDLDDETFIYWCIDDKFPVWLDIDVLRKTLSLISSTNLDGVDGLLLCRQFNHHKRRNLLTTKPLITDNLTFLQRANYKHIWIHQFARVKVIRHLFRSFPANIPAAKAMDHLKDKIIKPETHRLFVSQRSHCRFQESTSRGFITRDCLESFQAMGLNVPSRTIKARPQLLGRARRLVMV